jgi:cell division protease FtsH
MDNELNSNKSPKQKFSIYWVYGLVAIALVGLQFFFSVGGPVETTWQEVKTKMLASSDVKKIEVVRNKGVVYVYLKEASIPKYKDKLAKGVAQVPKVGPHFSFTIGNVETFDKNLTEAQATKAEGEKIYPEYIEESDYYSLLGWLLPFALIIGCLLYTSPEPTRPY